MRATAIATLLCLVVCPSCEQPEIERSQLQVRQIQTRTYDITDSKRALKAVLNVLQDQGYLPKVADLELGYVYAAKEVDVSSDSEAFWATFWKGKRGRWKKDSIVECAANVTEISDGMRVRLSFQVKVINNRGELMDVKTIDDPLFYQNFFRKIDKGIYLEKQGL